jgi:hypothetical protein
MAQSSFGMNSSVMTNKNHNLVACVTKCCPIEKRNIIPTMTGNHTAVTCFTPKNSGGTVSLVNNANSTSKKITTDIDLALIPANSIIDKVEFFGINGFATKGSFSIGLGQLNGSILTPLIENSNASIANEKVGGCREFISVSHDGKNSKTLVLLQSNVNIVLEHPITTGNLQVVIEYHAKPAPGQ